MQMSKTEKAVISALVISTAIGFFFLAGRVVLARKDAIGIISSIDASAKLTDKTPLEKGIYFNHSENADKLNLNRTDLKSIRAVPGMTAATARAIYNFVHVKSNGNVTDLNDLLKIKGMSKKKLKAIEPYVTVMGGHAGLAAWGEKLNLNFAREEDLSALPSVSKKLASNIIKFRNSNGNFTFIEELLDVEGMTSATFKKISKLVTTQ